MFDQKRQALLQVNMIQKCHNEGKAHDIKSKKSTARHNTIYCSLVDPEGAGDRGPEPPPLENHKWF